MVLDTERNENANRMSVANIYVCDILCKHPCEGQNLRSEFSYIIDTVHSSVLTVSCCHSASYSEWRNVDCTVYHSLFTYQSFRQVTLWNRKL